MATVTVSGEQHVGWAEVQLKRPKVHLSFLGGLTVNRDLPYVVVAVAGAGNNGVALSARSLFTAQLVVETSLQLRNGSLLVASLMDKRKEPMVPAWKHTSSLAEELRGLSGVTNQEVVGVVLEARYNDGTVRASVRRFLRVSEPRAGPRISVSSSTRSPKVGENIVFHVRSSQPVASLSYLVVSRGQVLVSAELAMAPHSARTFHLGVTQEMEPVATLLLYWPGGAGAVQSITFPVTGKQVGGRNPVITLIVQ
jgi:hypothetical protein